MSMLINRRSFLKVLTTASAGLVIEIYLPYPALAQDTSGTPEASSVFQPNMFLKIGTDGIVTIVVTRSEMGQGVRTALPMILAEELGADWSKVRVEQAPGDSHFGDQLTGGSVSVQTMYFYLRQAGAAARELIVAAAAQTWQVDKATCTAENGMVTQQESGKQLSFGSLVATAATLKLPDDIPLKKGNKNNRIVGKRVGRVDDPDIVTGRATFGLDVHVPGMLYATVTRPPMVGGQVERFDDSEARAVAGVRDVVQIDSGVAVVAEDTWAALRGRSMLKVTWKEDASQEFDSDDELNGLIKQINRGPTADATKLDAIYSVPFEAHATMEPMNCVADLQADHCEIWVPTQNPAAVRGKVATLSGLDIPDVKVNVTLIGGGFGRRLEQTLGGGSLPVGTDYVAEAVQLSKAVKAPVQVFWTRADDIQHDLYLPLTAIRVSAPLDNIRQIGMNHAQSYSMPTGNWRAVENVADAFAHESFLGEFAAATRTDLLDLERQVLGGRAKAVMELAASKAGWGTPLPAGQGRGLAYHSTWGATHVAMVAEVTVSDQGFVQVNRVVCAVDCGLPINPDMIESQMEGAIIFGLTTALRGSITVKKGHVQQNNFTNFPLLRFDEMPQIEVYIVPSDETPTGIGEMGNPVVAPAIANAVFAATGKRVRHLPILPQDIVTD